jgi:hypothetical protein
VPPPTNFRWLLTDPDDLSTYRFNYRYSTLGFQDAANLDDACGRCRTRSRSGASRWRGRSSAGEGGDLLTIAATRRGELRSSPAALGRLSLSTPTRPAVPQCRALSRISLRGDRPHRLRQMRTFGGW